MSMKITGRITILLVGLILPLVAVSGLKCHHCLSSSSLYDCGKSSEKIECPEIADNCANISTEVEASVGSIKSYFYGCATKKMCDDAKEQLKVCQKISGGGYKVKCNITCCNGDLCSPIVTSQSTMPLSGHFFLLPVIISALSYFKDYWTATVLCISNFPYQMHFSLFRFRISCWKRDKKKGAGLLN